MKFLIRFLECIFKWRVKSSDKRELADSQVILAQSFGLRPSDPGESNKALAKIVENLYKRFQLPLVLQWEIVYYLPDIPMEGIIREHRQAGKYLDTFEALNQSKDICKQHGWKKAIIIAHPDHIWRVAETARKMGFTVRIVDTQSVPYDSHSTQLWTRGRIRFLTREIPARILYLLRGWI